MTAINGISVMPSAVAHKRHFRPKIAAGSSDVVGRRYDGMVIAFGENYSGQLNLESWTDLVQVAAGGQHTVGLKAHHRPSFPRHRHRPWERPMLPKQWRKMLNHRYHLTAVAVGKNDWGQRRLYEWNSTQGTGKCFEEPMHSVVTNS